MSTHSVLFSPDLLSIILEFHGGLTLAAVCSELRTLTGQVAKFSLRSYSLMAYVTDAKLRRMVRARVANLSKKLHLDLMFDIPGDWKPKYTALLNEAASVEIQMSLTEVDEIPWKELRNVVDLYISRDEESDMELSSVAFLRDLLTLKRLYVNTGEIDLQYIEHLKELEYLALEVQQPCPNSTDALAGLRKLTYLDLSFSSGPRLDFIGVIPSLTSLCLAGAKIEDFSWLRHNTGLRTINLDLSSVTDAGVSLLRNCKNLVELSLRSTAVTDISVVECLPKLSVLELSELKHIKDFTPLSKALCLRELDLGCTNFSDLQILASLPRLQDLDCSGSSVTTLQPLTHFTALRKLSICNCKIECYAPIFEIDPAVLVYADIFKNKTLVRRLV